MHKIYKVCLCLFLTGWTYAQVGINTSTPDATLDVVASDPSAPSSTDGFLPPRVSTLPTGMTTDQTGMMVYLTTAVNAETPIGIYIYNGTAFQNLSTLANENLSIVRAFLSSNFFLDSNSRGGADPNRYIKIPFDQEDFDLKNEFDVSTGVFTAAVSGYYKVYVKASSNDFDGESLHGVAIYKNSTLHTLSFFEHDNGQTNGSSDSIERSAMDIIQLNAGETVEIRFSDNFATISNDKTSTYFTIDQIQ
jgi:hypothetical protein